MNAEERIGKAERRIKTVEDAVILLTVLTDSHNDRLESLLKNDDNLNAKISALVDAQINSEDRLESLLKNDDNLNTKISALIDAQINSEDRLLKINEALDKLTEFGESGASTIRFVEKIILNH